MHLLPMPNKPSAKLDPKSLFHDISRRDPVILAVSGGSDSMALLLLASAWSQLNEVQLQAVTVDHGLRPEAAAEAAFVAGTCEALGVSHVTLAWDGLKPSTGLPEASRLARYQLLEEFAIDIGARIILTAHSADDQAETVYMRLMRSNSGSIGFGHSGMDRVTRLPKGISLVRPVLGQRREALRDYLTEHSQSWVEDPSNRDFAYERVRVRHRLLEAPELLRQMLDYSDLMGRYRALISKQAAVFLKSKLKCQPGLVYEFGHQALLELPRPVQCQILRVVLAAAGGRDHFTSSSKTLSLLTWAGSQNRDDLPARMTLGNCVVAKRSGKLSIFREHRNLGPALLGSKDRLIWDGRFVVQNDTNGGLYVGPMDKALLHELEVVRGARFPVTPRAALLSLPVLKLDQGESFVPFLENGPLPNGISIGAVCRPVEHFAGRFDAPIFEWFEGWKRDRSEPWSASL